MTRGSVTQTRSFTYSGSDLATETTPEAGTVTYTYDNNHHVTQRTDAKGQQTQYAYDSYERLTEVRHYTPTGTTAPSSRTKPSASITLRHPRHRPSRLDPEQHLGPPQRRGLPPERNDQRRQLRLRIHLQSGRPRP